jgi:hypothetical protein
MKLSTGEHAFDHSMVKSAQRRFGGLLVELGVRKNNEFIGSGLGGNNFQLLCLFGMVHELSPDTNVSISFSSVENTMYWGAEWLIRSSRYDLRKELDKIFSTIKEGHKYWALVMETLSESGDLRTTLPQYQDQFPELMACLAGKNYKFQPWLGPLSQLILAYVMCQELAAELDRNDTSKVQVIGSALYDFPAEIILLSVRKYIWIDRIVRFNLDEDPIFWKTLNKVNKRVDL